MRYRVIFAAALASLPTTTSARAAPPGAPAYCPQIEEIVSLATTKGRFSDIAGKPQQGDFHDTTLPLAGWSNCSLYGAGTYTCDSAGGDTGQQADAAPAAILQEVKACLGVGWSEADGRSSPSHVVLHSALRPVSITLSMDATDNKTHVVHLIVFIRRR